MKKRVYINYPNKHLKLYKNKRRNLDERYTPDIIKVPIYPDTDLRYLKHRDFDVSTLRKYNKDKAFLFKENKDTVEYRIKECMKTGGDTLDLSNMDLSTLPKIPPSVKFLFCPNNKLRNMDAVCKLHLVTLDCSNNRLNKLPALPVTLEELSCQNNELVDLIEIKDCIQIRRLDCSYNKITRIPRLYKLTSLNCRNNQLSYLPNLPLLINLMCKYNHLTTVGIYPELERMECNNNQITKLGSFPKLCELYCENNMIHTLGNMPRLMMLHCYNNKLLRIPYFKYMDTVACDLYDMTKLSGRYNILEKVHQECKQSGKLYVMYTISGG